MNDVWTWLIAVIALVGAITNTQKWVISYWLYLVANGAWIIWACYYEVWPQFVLFLGFEIITIYGLIRWTKDNKSIKFKKEQEKVWKRRKA